MEGNDWAAADIEVDRNARPRSGSSRRGERAGSPRSSNRQDLVTLEVRKGDLSVVRTVETDVRTETDRERIIETDVVLPAGATRISDTIAGSVRESDDSFRHSFGAVLFEDTSLFVDLWLLLGALWTYRALVGHLDPAAATFGLSALSMLLSPRVRPRRLIPNALDDVGGIVRRISIAFVFASVVQLLTRTGEPLPLVVLAFATPPLLLTGRAIHYARQRLARTRRPTSRIVIVGSGDVARRVVRTLADHPEYGMEAIGAVDDEPELEASKLGTPFLGGIDEMSALVRNHEVEGIIVAPMSEDRSIVLKSIRVAMAWGVSVWVIPRLVEFGLVSASDHLWGLPVVRLQPLARNRPEWVLKRSFDVALALTGLVVMAPLLAIIALLLYLESGRPILFRQTRVGQDGRAFELLKFRTMRTVSQAELHREWQEALKAGNASLSDDSARVTRLGHFLRHTGIDELPQLVNVLRGDMSLVGARPERPFFIESFTRTYPEYDLRHRFPTGITGWAQVHGLRGDTSIEERIAFDNYYIENWSMSRDVRIILRTMVLMLKKMINLGIGRRGDRVSHGASSRGQVTETPDMR
jgi:exopolysaccharide biosynthesis polyprenyl glycosylphosphotransferase